MNDEPIQPPPAVIRITRDEAYSEHADDLVNRLLSMRGEAVGATRARGRWYYRNWFIFMLTGAIAGCAAWALLEPYFDDMLYIQGPIEAIGSEAPSEETRAIGIAGWVQVAGQQVLILDQARSYGREGLGPVIDFSALQQGQAIGLHVLSEPMQQAKVAAAMFVDPNPPPNPPEKAGLSLEALASRTTAAGAILFAVVAGMIGLLMGAVDGMICRLFRRALLAGAVGCLAGLLGGFLSGVVANLVYAPLNQLATQQEGAGPGGMTTFGFTILMGGRALAWCLAGMAMGLGQGLALRSGRLLLYGFLGGILGGLFGGLFFDPIDLLLLKEHPSGHWSRLVGIMAVGAGVGFMIGIVELLARDAWLNMRQGPLAGKEFLLFKDLMRVGASPRCELYLFNDPVVAPEHAIIRAMGDGYEIENRCRERPVCVNGRPVGNVKLRHGDQISIGRTVFVFQKRRG